ncbi:MAG TPA: GNAT family N-acetyltransferase [Bacteroidia bacterium]|jgi:GNAT superfamily N-acetyltransferase|nr:GNAT family N-acetyltransferase [Bacteroidia bacterium]
MYKIKLIPKESIKSIIPLAALLNPNLTEEILIKRLDMMMEMNYECLGVFDKENLIGICGLWTLVKLYNGKHLEPDNVIIHPDYRNKGIGELMMAWIDNYAKEQNCEVIELNCYVENLKGIEFWKKTGLYIRGHHFQKLVKK